MIGLLAQLPTVANKKGWPWTEESDPKIYNMRTAWPKITIVTPSFNQGSFIEQTVRSILLQNYPNLEYLIIDGESTDETVEIIRNYSNHINYWISEKDDGQSQAINKGLEKCTGEYFNWINSDDYLQKDALLNLALKMESGNDLIAGYCTVFIEETNEIELIYRLPIAKSPEETIVEHAMCQPAMFYKTKILKHFGGVENSLHYVMDLALFVRYVSEFGTEYIRLVPDRIAFFRKHSQSKTQKLQELFDQEERLLYSYLLFLSNESEERINLISYETFRPKPQWPLKLNRHKLLTLIYKKLLLKKASQAYAQSDYPLMKTYTNCYLQSGVVVWSLTTLKLMISSFIVPLPLIKSSRKFYKRITSKR